MTALTIIFDDKTLGQDGVFYSPIDLSNAPSGLHALQWNGNEGWIEYAENFDGKKQANEFISELPDWVNGLIDQWKTLDEAKKINLSSTSIDTQQLQ